MSNRAERRAAERTARKLANKQAPAAQPSSISPAQLQANQQNAKSSTGPTSPEGKAVSALNNTRHGLAADTAAPGTFRVLACEDQSAYDQSVADFKAEWKPATATEHALVDRMVIHQWLRLRALRLQESLFDTETGEITDVKKFELYRRYETSHERGFNKAFADMQRLRSFQQRIQIGFESQRRKNEEHAFKMHRLQQAEERKATPKCAASISVNTANGELPATVTA